MVLERATVHYQPIIDLDTGAIAGFEALLRTVDGDGNAGSIDPVIEQIESDPVVLDRLMRRLLGMISRDAVPLCERYPAFYVGVNVPPAILGARTALGEPAMRVMLAEFALEPYLGRLVCEITERQALSAQGRAALELARQVGIRLAVDDVGTGHSGIAQMLGLTIDVLKLDRSQVVLLTKDVTAERLVRDEALTLLDRVGLAMDEGKVLARATPSEFFGRPEHPRLRQFLSDIRTPFPDAA
ncbi:MAG: EAL domain-containing protein [Candidatus Accumulibacter phosphatis]|nr:EAL domain-containing protein [Candidatus Accumulibacter contiguus]